MPLPIGILGGTFDPVHNGHLRAAIEAFEALRLEHIRLVPLNQPGHRGAPCASAADRLAMLKTVETPPLVVDACEIERGGTSYTVDTLLALRTRWPSCPLILILGQDAFASLPGWHQADEVLSLAHIVVATRPQSQSATPASLDKLIADARTPSIDDLHQQHAGRIFMLDIPLLPISSSDLRARCTAGRDIRHLVPDGVHDIIIKRGLYLQ